MSLYCFLTILLWTGRLGIGMNGRIRIGIGGRFTQEYAVLASSNSLNAFVSDAIQEKLMRLGA